MTTVQERNQEATVYVGGLDERVTDAVVFELMTQVGPVVNVHLPKDRVSMSHQGYGFVEFATEEDADYAIKILNLIKLYGKPIRVNKASSDKKEVDVGATIFIGNLDPEVDESVLYETFSQFGTITSQPKITRDPDTGESKGHGFVSFDNFDSSDAAIQAMNGQFLCNKKINVSYALKKDGKGEKHGSAAERLLASQARKHMHPVPLPGAIPSPAAYPPGIAMQPPPMAPPPGLAPPPLAPPPPIPVGLGVPPVRPPMPPPPPFARPM